MEEDFDLDDEDESMMDDMQEFEPKEQTKMRA